MEERMQAKASQSGFTLVELLVAMTCTLLVSGAIYGLLSGGQNAFRREPQITDMQQNLRMAMDVIMRDVTQAGQGIPSEAVGGGLTGQVQALNGAFVQVFTQGLDNGGACTLRTGETGCPRPPRPTDPARVQRTDDLEMFLSNSQCGAESVCGYQSGSASQIDTSASSTCVNTGDTPIFFMGDGTWTIRQVVSQQPNGNQSSRGNCVQAPHANINFNSGRGANSTGDDTLNVPGGLCESSGIGTVTGQRNCNPVFLLQAELVTYRVTTGSDGVPNLERRSTASMASGFNNAFQVVARGIEDMQVQYSTAAQPDTFVDGAPRIQSPNYGTLITQVRVTLWGRTEQTNLVGQSTYVGGTLAYVRSTLTSTASVRPALQIASREYVKAAVLPGPPQWN
jgi:prepilin-type N-terminal cleavage/methylation domain-containing protein